MKDNFLTVSTFLWSDPERNRSYTFAPAHVVILRNMVRRHLKFPHEFVVVTDDLMPKAPGFSPDSAERDGLTDIVDYWRENGIRAVPLDMSKHVPGTVFARLCMRNKRYAAGLIGRRILNLDLDMVIVKDITPLVNRDEPSVFWRNPNFETGNRRAFYQTSVQLFDAGSHEELYKDFDPDYTPTWVNRRFGGKEQAWVSERLDWDLPYWDEQHGIYGAGRLFRDRPDKGVGAELPDNARIISFPGDRMPEDDEMKKNFPWIDEHYK